MINEQNIGKFTELVKRCMWEEVVNHKWQKGKDNQAAELIGEEDEGYDGELCMRVDDSDAEEPH
jgi:hypothetical protein